MLVIGLFPVTPHFRRFMVGLEKLKDRISGGGVSDLSGKKREKYIQEMFTHIATRYDMMNQIMTAGQDVRWRKWVIERAAVGQEGKLLDLGAGTGDLARENLRQHPNSFSLAADFTLEMMRVGKARQHGKNIIQHWSAADAAHLPFSSQTFEAVVSGFLLRNVSDLSGSLQEQYRVLRPGGRIVALDTTPPPASPLAPFIHFYLHSVIPTLGQLLTSRQEAYRYLPDSTEKFLQPEQLASRLIAAGFTQVGFQRAMFGTIAIYWGTKSV